MINTKNTGIYTKTRLHIYVHKPHTTVHKHQTLHSTHHTSHFTHHTPHTILNKYTNTHARNHTNEITQTLENTHIHTVNQHVNMKQKTKHNRHYKNTAAHPKPPNTLNYTLHTYVHSCIHTNALQINITSCEHHSIKA